MDRPMMRAAFAALLLAWPAAARGDALAETLAPHVGETIDVVELGTGRRFVRPTLSGVVENGGRVESLRLVPEEGGGIVTVPLKGVVKIVAGRETIHEAEAVPKGASQIRGQRLREAYRAQLAASHERMRAHGIAPWPELSADEHAAEVADLRAFVDEVRTAFPALAVTETHEFIVATDIPAEQMRPYVASLDRMHDFLCDLYGIPRGEAVWKGKCLVVAFLRESDFVAFEARFMRVSMAGAHGLCHQSGDGRVIMACHRGDDAAAFAHMLVHETSHGFNHRWLSPARIPNWLNEGVAEWVGTKVVPQSNQVPLKEARAVALMKARGTLGADFFTAPNIAADQYGIASGLVKFMAARDPKKFAALVRSVKEGAPVEEALEETFHVTLPELVTAFGKAIGVPGLVP